MSDSSAFHNSTQRIERDNTQPNTPIRPRAQRFEETKAVKEESVEQLKAKFAADPFTKKSIRCDTEHCGHPAAGLLALRFYCLGHFISHCYEKLDRCNPNPFNDADVVTSVAVDRFLQQCMAQAGELVRPIRGYDNLDRARLFDIFLWASDLVAKRSVFKGAIVAATNSEMDLTDAGENWRFRKAGAD